MAQLTSKTSNLDDSDFGAHLQRRFGISACELGECLTEYHPSRPYQIVVADRPQSVSCGDFRRVE